MRPFHPRGLLAVGVFLIVSVMVMAGARNAPSHGAPSSMAFDCWVSCGQAPDLECGGSDHVALQGYMVDNTGPHGPHASCLTSTCDFEGGPEGMHTSCVESQNLAISGDYERLKAAIAAQDDGSLHNLLGRYPRALVVNAARESLQVVSCDGTPRANLPLQAEQFERLVNAQ